MRKLLFLFVSVSLCCCRESMTGDILVRDVNVVDVEAGKVIEHQNVLITNDTIVCIDSEDREYVVKTEVNGTGKYMIPGLWDMHTHNWWNIHFSDYYVGNGVLGVRNMYTPMKFIQPLKDSIAQKLIMAPRYYAAGRVVEGEKPEFDDWFTLDSASDVGLILDTLEMEHSDFVKVYNKISPLLYDTLLSAAKSRGMHVEGHCPMAISALHASEMGQRSIEHLLGIPELCTDSVLFAARRKEGRYNYFSAVMNEPDYATFVMNDSLAVRNFRFLRDHDTYVCPTLVVWYNYFHPKEKLEGYNVYDALPEEMKQYWTESIGSFAERDSVYQELGRMKYERFRQITLLLFQQGVPMMTGTDAINPFVYPGFSLHHEMKLLKSCGIPDVDVLRMATINPARFMGKQGVMGQVKVGMVGSLVLLNGNPLEDIENCSGIAGVIHLGKYLDAEQCAAMRH